MKKQNPDHVGPAFEHRRQRKALKRRRTTPSSRIVKFGSSTEAHTYERVPPLPQDHIVPSLMANIANACRRLFRRKV